MKVAHVLRQKSPGVETVDATAPLATAIERFSSAPVRCLVVTDGTQVVGMLTMRDLLRSLQRGSAALDAPVSEAMSTDVAFVTPETPLEEVQHVIASRRVNHVPVLEQDELVGIVTLADLLRGHLNDVNDPNAELRRYIHGPYVF